VDDRRVNSGLERGGAQM